MIGITSCQEYNIQIQQYIKQNIDIPFIIINTFISYQQLCSILSYTIVNIHPCSYDAYGMTIIEAAACAVPSIVSDSNKIGSIVSLVKSDSCISIHIPSNDHIPLLLSDIQNI